MSIKIWYSILRCLAINMRLNIFFMHSRSLSRGPCGKDDDFFHWLWKWINILEFRGSQNLILDHNQLSYTLPLYTRFIWLINMKKKMHITRSTCDNNEASCTYGARCKMHQYHYSIKTAWIIAYLKWLRIDVSNIN